MRKKGEFCCLKTLVLQISNVLRVFSICIYAYKPSSYLHDKRFRCRLTGHSCRKSRWLSPHIGRCSDRGRRSCCSGRGSRLVLPAWSSPSPPGPGSHRWAAESGCIPGSLFVWMRYLLHQNTNTASNNLYVQKKKRLIFLPKTSLRNWQSS